MRVCGCPFAALPQGLRLIVVRSLNRAFLSVLITTPIRPRPPYCTAASQSRPNGTPCATAVLLYSSSHIDLHVSIPLSTSQSRLPHHFTAPQRTITHRQPAQRPDPPFTTRAPTYRLNSTGNTTSSSSHMVTWSPPPLTSLQHHRHG